MDLSEGKDVDQNNENVAAMDNSDSPSKEGKHMHLLRQCISLTVTKFISSAKFSLFRENLKPLYKSNPEALRKIHQQMTQQLEANIYNEVSIMFEEEDILTHLNKLDDLIQNNPHRDTVAWRPSGDPELDVLAHTMSCKEKQKKHLQHIVTELQSQNKLLKDALRPRQKHLLQTMQNVEKVTDKWREATKVSQEMPTEEFLHFLNNNG